METRLLQKWQTVKVARRAVPNMMETFTGSANVHVIVELQGRKQIILHNPKKIFPNKRQSNMCWISKRYIDRIRHRVRFDKEKINQKCLKHMMKCNGLQTHNYQIRKSNISIKYMASLQY